MLTFCSQDLSAFYLDVLKDRLYSSGANSRERRSAQTALFEITSTVARLLAPILSFTAEEVWQKLSLPDKPVSVLLAALPSYRADVRDHALETRWEPLLATRELVNKALEGTKKRLELGMTLTADAETYAALHPYLSQLPALFLVSQVILRQSGVPGLQIENNGPAPGTRCARCWVAVLDGGEDPAAFCAAGCSRRWQVSSDGEVASRRLI